ITGAALLGTGACEQKKPVTPETTPPPMTPSADPKDLGKVQAKLGEKVVVTGPAVPVHPSFVDAKTVADYDHELLHMESEAMDGSRLGASAKSFTFKTLKAGNGVVVLR